MADLPIMCTLTPAELEARRHGPLLDLVRRAESHEALPTGLRFDFAAASDTLAALAHAVDLERQCCRFLRFAITVAPDGGPIALELTGPPGTREFLSALLEA